MWVGPRKLLNSFFHLLCVLDLLRSLLYYVLLGEVDVVLTSRFSRLCEFVCESLGMQILMPSCSRASFVCLDCDESILLYTTVGRATALMCCISQSGLPRVCHACMRLVVSLLSFFFFDFFMTVRCRERMCYLFA